MRSLQSPFAVGAAAVLEARVKSRNRIGAVVRHRSLMRHPKQLD
jgi:hypothetical protein